MHEVGGRGCDGGGAGWQRVELQIGCSDLMQECNREKNFYFVILYKKDQDRKVPQKNHNANRCRLRRLGPETRSYSAETECKGQSSRNAKRKGGGGRMVGEWRGSWI